MTDKKEPRKKTDTEKKAEKDAMVNLWMNNLGAEEKPEVTPEREKEKGS